MQLRPALERIEPRDDDDVGIQTTLHSAQLSLFDLMPGNLGLPLSVFRCARSLGGQSSVRRAQRPYVPTSFSYSRLQLCPLPQSAAPGEVWVPWDIFCETAGYLLNRLHLAARA